MFGVSISQIASSHVAWVVTMRITQLSVLNIISDLQFGLLIALLITAVYWNSLQGSFIWDDRAAIVSLYRFSSFSWRNLSHHSNFRFRTLM
jgi:hypothetical protein